MSAAWWAVLINAVLVFGGVVAAYYTFIGKVNERLSIIENRCVTHAEWGRSISVMEKDVQKLQAQNEVFWQVVQPHLGNIIHSPLSKDRDELVDKFLNGDITDDEMVTLAAMLDSSIRSGRWSAEKTFAGALLLGRVVSLIDRRKVAL